MPERRPVLRAAGVRRSFAAGGGRTEVVRGAGLEVAEGEVVVILGRSGAGKTALLSLLGGLDRPDAGTIEVGGQDVTALAGDRRDAFLQRTVGWVFQTSGLMPLLTAQENVWLGLRISGLPAAEASAQAARALAAVGLTERASHRAGELSGGEQQRVALARALVKSPLLLVADEPTAQLDSETARTILALVREAADSGTAVLLATHDRGATEVADRVLLMEDGVLIEAAAAV